MINRAGLGDYYSRRAGILTSKVSENIFISEESFQSCVTPDGAVFYITSVRCAACVWLVENLIKRREGVQDARVNYATYRVSVSFDNSKVSLKEILETVARAGYPPVPENPEQINNEKRELLLRFIVGAFFSMQLMLYSVASYVGYFQDMPPHIKLVMQYISMILTTPIIIYTGYPFFRSAYKHLSMDTLVALGAGSAYLYSVIAVFAGYETYFDTAATILTLITLGRYIELSAKHKAKSGILSLFTLSAPFARVVTAEGESILPLSQVKVGDVLQVLAGDRVPVDGKLQSGSGEVDESMLTGEPLPKNKGEGDLLFAGTINMNGSFNMIAESVGSGTVLAQIVSAIESADLSRTKLVRLVDRVSSIFVPVVLLIAVATFIVSGSLMNSIAVLVVACPCALGLAAPLAVTVALGKAFSLNAIVRNGDLFENIVRCKRIYFDKTGTLTESNELRRDSVEVIDNIRKKYSVTILSGDNRANVERVAGELGVEFMAELSPFNKAEIVGAHADTMMVGDGINDAPALKRAGIGVAVGANIASVAIDSADLILLKPDLHILEEIIALSKRTARIVRENLFWAFAYNVVAIPLAAVGVLHPVVSAICMSVSSIAVVVNSMRIRG
jgi:cation transport ATPase